jgi:hypothetical protein
MTEKIERKRWHFLPDLSEGKEVWVSDFETLLTGLERTYTNRVKSTDKKTVESLLPLLLEGVFGCLRELVQGREFTARLGRKIEQLFLHIQTLMSVAAMISHEELYGDVSSLVGKAISRGRAVVKVGDLKGILSSAAHFEKLKKSRSQLARTVEAVRSQLSEVKTLRLEAVEHLNQRHPGLNCTPDHLCTLSKELKNEGRTYLRRVHKRLTLNPDTLKEVFRKSKPSRQMRYAP